MASQRRRRSPRSSAAQGGGGVVAEPIAIGELVANPANPRRHPERQIASLMASLERFGQPKPIVARSDDRMVLAGHGVLEAAKRLGWLTVSVVLVDWDDRTARAFMLADNRLPDLARDDSDAIAAILADIDQFELNAIGFTEEEAKLFASIADPTDDLVISEIDVSDVHDEFWVSLHGPLAKQAMVLQALEDLMAHHDDVELRIGTVNNG